MFTTQIPNYCFRGGMNIKNPNFEHPEPQRIEHQTHSNISFGPKTKLRTSQTSPKTELFMNFINKKWTQFFPKSSKPNFENVRTCDFGQKPNFEPPKHHQKPNSSRTLNCSFHLYIVYSLQEIMCNTLWAKSFVSQYKK